MDEIRRTAYLCIGRACGFAGLAVFTTVVGLAFDPLLAARSGGVLMTIVTIVLLLKSRLVYKQDYRRTELWIMLDKEHRPPAGQAHWAMATVLNETYLWFAQYAAGLAVVFWTVALALSFFKASA